ncbi:response regulator UvrY [bacterium BMS3Abin04]|nr:response regulator UvrY [bacterium BMS3Abin04]
MKILVADDHTIVREGIKQIVASMSQVTIVEEASTGFEVIEKVNAKHYDVVLLDISMPGKSGLDVLKEIKTYKPKLPVLILSIHSEDQYAKRVLKAGAAGFIPKHSAPEELKKAILKAFSGGRYVSNHLAEKLATELSLDNNQPLHETLSDREFQVLQKIASGKPLKDIADELFISIKTVSTYRTRILEKLHLNNNAELIKYALENELID